MEIPQHLSPETVVLIIIAVVVVCLCGCAICVMISNKWGGPGGVKPRYTAVATGDDPFFDDAHENTTPHGAPGYDYAADVDGGL